MQGSWSRKSTEAAVSLKFWSCLASKRFGNTKKDFSNCNSMLEVFRRQKRYGKLLYFPLTFLYQPELAYWQYFVDQPPLVSYNSYTEHRMTEMLWGQAPQKHHYLSWWCCLHYSVGASFIPSPHLNHMAKRRAVCITILVNIQALYPS